MSSGSKLLGLLLRARHAVPTALGRSRRASARAAPSGSGSPRENDWARPVCVEPAARRQGFHRLMARPRVRRAVGCGSRK